MLDVGAGGVEIALVLVGARAPLEDLGAQAVARAAGARAELEGERQVVDARELAPRLTRTQPIRKSTSARSRSLKPGRCAICFAVLSSVSASSSSPRYICAHERASQAAQSEVGKLAGDDGEVVQQSNGVVPTRLLDRLLGRDDLRLERARAPRRGTRP